MALTLLIPSHFSRFRQTVTASLSTFPVYLTTTRHTPHFSGGRRRTTASVSIRCWLYLNRGRGRRMGEWCRNGRDEGDILQRQNFYDRRSSKQVLDNVHGNIYLDKVDFDLAGRWRRWGIVWLCLDVLGWYDFIFLLLLLLFLSVLLINLILFWNVSMFFLSVNINIDRANRNLQPRDFEFNLDILMKLRMFLFGLYDYFCRNLVFFSIFFLSSCSCWFVMLVFTLISCISLCGF